jgi:hypothetical protein
VAQIIKEIHCRKHKQESNIKYRQSRTHRKRVCQKGRWWGRERSRHTAFVTGGGLGAFLLLLAIVSVPLKKNPSTTTVIVVVTCVGKKEGLEWI